MVLMKKILFSILCSFAFCFSFAQQDIFNINWSSKNAVIPPVSVIKNYSGDSANVIITIDPSEKIANILPTHFANNGSSWMGAKVLSDNIRKTNFKNVGINYMRFPGGTLSNSYFWDGVIPSVISDPNLTPISGTDNAWRLTVDQFLELCDTLKSEPVITINFSLARYYNGPDPVQYAAHYAAEWVRYVKNKGHQVTYWEVGNENYGSWEPGYIIDNDTITGAKYGDIFNVIADSMKAADLVIKLGAVMVPSDNGILTSSGYNWWNKGVVSKVIDTADFWIMHEYFTNNPKNLNLIKVADILGSVHLVKDDINNMQASVAKYSGKPADYLPVAMTEFNLRGGNKEVSQLSALFLSQIIGELIKNNYGMFMLWDMQNGTRSDGGDMGFVSWKDSILPNGTPRPSFFTYYYLNKISGDQMINAVSNDDSVSVYSTSFTDGHLGLWITNIAGNKKSVSIAPNGFTGKNIFWYELTAPSDTSKKVYINGYTNNQYSQGGPLGYDTIKPFSHPCGSTASIDIQPSSVNFIIMEKDLSTQVSNENSTGRCSIIPNPSSDIFYLKTNANGVLFVFDITGKSMFSKTFQNEISFGETLDKGIYLVKIITNESVQTYKIIKY